MFYKTRWVGKDLMTRKVFENVNEEDQVHSPHRELADLSMVQIYRKALNRREWK